MTRLLPRLFLGTFVFTSLCFGTAHAIDLQKLGRPLDDDSKTMYDRLVYFDDQTTSKNVPLNKAVLSNNEMQEWLRQHVPMMLTLEWNHYTQEVTVNRRFFTPVGYGQYKASLEAAQLERLMTEQRYNLRAMALSPRLTAQGLREDTDAAGNKEDVYVWQAQIPVTLTYDNLTAPQNFKILVVAEVVRIKMQDDGALVAFNNWRLAPAPETIDPLDPVASE